MPKVTVRYWAAAKHAAGVAEEKLSAGTLAELLTQVVASRQCGAAPAAAGGQSAGDAGELRAVLARSSFLLDGEQVGGRAAAEVPLPEGAVVEVLPPFAGG